MSTVVDMNEVKGSDFESLPAGLYKVEFAKTELTASKTSGAPMIKATLKVVDGEYAKRNMFDNIIWMDKTMWKVKQVLQAINSPLLTKKITVEDVEAELKGKVAVVYVEPSVTSTGKPSNEVKRYESAGEPTAAESGLYS